MTVKIRQKCPCVHIWVNSQKRQLTDFDLYSNFRLKCLKNKVKIIKIVYMYVHVQILSNLHVCKLLYLIIIIIIIIIQKICSAHISTLLGAQGANPETPGQAPSLSR